MTEEAANDNNSETLEINHGIDSATESKICELEQIYTNKFYIGWGKEGIIRLTFADMISDKNENVNFVISLLLTPSGLLSLQSLINNFVTMKQTETQEANKKPGRESLN